MARVRGLHRRRCAIAGKIVFELDVKQPVLDAPMAACGPGDTLDIDGDIKARVGAAVGVFGARIDLDHGLDVGEARFAWIFAIGCDPIDLVGGDIEPRLDTAMPLLDGRFTDEFGGGRVPKARQITRANPKADPRTWIIRSDRSSGDAWQR
jgi:hypothetical protein